MRTGGTHRHNHNNWRPGESPKLNEFKKNSFFCKFSNVSSLLDWKVIFILNVQGQSHFIRTFKSILNLLKCVSCIFNKIFLDMVGEQNSSNAKDALTSKDQVWMFELSDFFTILNVKTFLWPKKSKRLRGLIDMLSPSEPISLIMNNIKFLAILRNHIKNNFLTYFICFSEAWLELN